MKDIFKRLAIAAYILLVALAYLGLGLFVGCSDVDTQTEAVDMTGTWKLIADVNYGNIDFYENDYIVFDGDNAAYYSDGAQVSGGAYTIDEANTFELNGQTYCAEFTEDEKVVRLYQTDNYFKVLVRYDTDKLTLITDSSAFSGTWEVVLHGGTAVYGETMTFTDSSLTLTSADGTQKSSGFVWDDSDASVYISYFNVDLRVYKPSLGCMFMIETDSGNVWYMTSDSDSYDFSLSGNAQSSTDDENDESDVQTDMLTGSWLVAYSDAATFKNAELVFANGGISMGETSLGEYSIDEITSEDSTITQLTALSSTFGVEQTKSGNVVKLYRASDGVTLVLVKEEDGVTISAPQADVFNGTSWTIEMKGNSVTEMAITFNADGTISLGGAAFVYDSAAQNLTISALGVDAQVYQAGEGKIILLQAVENSESLVWSLVSAD